MAYTATHADTGVLSKFFSSIGGAIASWSAQTAERQIAPLRAEINALHAMSDAELVAQHITRDDIEIRVFSRYFYC